MWALLAFGNRVVTAIVHVLLAFFAELLFLVRLNTTCMVALLALGFGLHAAALPAKRGTATDGERY